MRIIDEDYGDSSDEEMEDWSDDDGDCGDYSRDDPSLNHPYTLGVDT